MIQPTFLCCTLPGNQRPSPHWIGFFTVEVGGVSDGFSGQSMELFHKISRWFFSNDNPSPLYT
jgi:hypothetical protein